MPTRCLSHFVALLCLLLGACASLPPPAPASAPPATSVELEAPAIAPYVAPTPVADSTGAPVPSDAVPGATAAPAPPADAGVKLLAATRRTARSTAEWLARGIDSWFGPVPFDEGGGSVSDGRLSLGFFKRQDQEADIDLRFTARYRLPNIERGAYLFVGRDVRRDVVRDTPDTLARQQYLRSEQTSDPTLLAGVGVSLFDQVDFRIGLGGGAKPYFQARYEHEWVPAPGHLVEFRETVFWTNDDRFGSTTALSYEYVWSPTVVLRWLNAVTYTQESRNFEYSNSLGTYKSLPGLRLLSLELVFNGTDTRRTGGGLSDIGLLARYEQPIYESWAFLEVVGGHYWPRPDSLSPRGRAWAFGATLKLLF